ncbi:MAG: hypothetical protein ACU0CC_15615 [Sagittula sp.]
MRRKSGCIIEDCDLPTQLKHIWPQSSLLIGPKAITVKSVNSFDPNTAA